MTSSVARCTAPVENLVTAYGAAPALWGVTLRSPHPYARVTGIKIGDVVLLRYALSSRFEDAG